MQASRRNLPLLLSGAVLEILPLQLLAAEVALRRGLRADEFRYEQDDTKLDGR